MPTCPVSGPGKLLRPETDLRPVPRPAPVSDLFRLACEAFRLRPRYGPGPLGDTAPSDRHKRPKSGNDRPAKTIYVFS